MSKIELIEEEKPAPKFEIPTIYTQRELVMDKGEPYARQITKSTLELIQDACSPTESEGALEQLAFKIGRLQEIIARMICRQPVSLQLEITGQDSWLSALKEGTENV